MNWLGLIFKRLGEALTLPARIVADSVSTWCTEFNHSMSVYFSGLFKSMMHSVGGTIAGGIAIIFVLYGVWHTWRMIMSHDGREYSRAVNRMMFGMALYYIFRMGVVSLLHI